MSDQQRQYYELYRRSSIGSALTDTLDDLIKNRQIEPQLAMKIINNFDKAIADTLSEKVKSRMSFKGHLDTYRFCDEVWTFVLKDITVKLDNSTTVHADKIKIVSCNSKKPGEELLSPNREKTTSPPQKRKPSDTSGRARKNAKTEVETERRTKPADDEGGPSLGPGYDELFEELRW